MKKIFNKSELGSIMIEALAMLALIALVTPLLYKKTSERMRELQDINSASELRTIIKAVDDYIGSNYDTLVAGGTITNSCPGTVSGKDVKTQSYSGLTGSNHRTEVPIGHFCEFLPYGVLKGDGTAQVSKLFKDYKIVLKLQGSTTQGAEGTKRDNYVITAFVITDPQVALPELRSSSIASMIGGNGGYVYENTGNSGTSASQGKIRGNLGLWGIDNTSTDLGVTVKKGAVVAASIQGISSQNANIDIDDVLYRRARAQKDLNTMFTTLYMGQSGSNNYGNDIVNIKRMIVGQRSTDDSNKLYIKSGNIKIGEGGNIAIAGGGNFSITGGGNVSTDTGNFSTTTGNFTTGTGDVSITSSGKFYTKSGNFETDSGDFATKSGKFTSEKDGSLELTNSLDTAIKINDSVFTVAKDGVTKALNFQTNNGNVQINVGTKGSETTTIKEPVIIEKTGGTCTFANTSGCALTVKGGEYVEGNLIVSETFDAKNLHARENLTVGGDDPTKGPALSVAYASNASTLNFGNDLFKVTQTAASLGSLNFASSLINAEKTSSTAAKFGVTVPNAENNEIGLRTGTSNLILKKNIAQLAGDSTYFFQIKAADKVSELTTNNINFNSTAFNSHVKTFTVTPTAKTGYLEINDNGDYGSMYAKALDTYFKRKDTDNTYLRIGQNPANSQQIDISSEEITMRETNKHDNTNNYKILKIDLKNTSVDNNTFATGQDDYPIYIRKGGIELLHGVNPNYEKSNNDRNVYNYVKADRFVSNKKTDGGDDKHNNDYADLRNADGTGKGATNYIVNPAYTSVMRDIKLTSRGGARLSDILPDFINKGIYVVDNTYPAPKQKCGGKEGHSLSEYQQGSGSGPEKNGAGDLAKENGSDGKIVYKGYKNYSNEKSNDYVGQCDSSTQEVSPWLGFVPRPTCPPGYMAVITLTPTSFAIAQAGFARRKSEWMTDRNGHSSTNDLYTLSNSIKSPLDYTGEGADADAPIPFYSQKNTWLKSDAVPYPSSPDCTTTSSCEGWDLSMGYIYPYQWYKDYIKEADPSYPSGKLALDTQGPANDDDQKIIWNLFPVYAGSLEGYATVYCYFQRSPKAFHWNSNTVDTGYDQIGAYRDATDHTAAGGAKTNSGFQNANDNDLGYW